MNFQEITDLPINIRQFYLELLNEEMEIDKKNKQNLIKA